MDKITDATTVSTTELACVLGLTARRIQQMAQDGTMPTVSKGKFTLTDSVQRYISFISGNELSEEEKKIEKTRNVAEAQIKAAKASIAKAEAAEIAGRMHRSKDVEEITTAMIAEFRSALMGLPGQIAMDIDNAFNTNDRVRLIRKSIYAVMEELSRFEYDPAKYADRVRERQKWESDVSGDE